MRQFGSHSILPFQSVDACTSPVKALIGSGRKIDCGVQPFSDAALEVIDKLLANNVHRSKFHVVEESIATLSLPISRPDSGKFYALFVELNP